MTAQNLLRRIERELTLVMGPVAPVIIRDKTAEFGDSTQDFPQESLAELVEEVSFEIHNSRKKAMFQRAALNILRDVSGEPDVAENDHALKVEPEKKPRADKKQGLRLAKEQGPKGAT